MATVRGTGPRPPVPYPSHRVADVVLLDGSTVRFRPVIPADVDQILALFGRLSKESLARRFHGVHQPTRTEAEYFCSVDYQTTFGLVAEQGAGAARQIVALASYVSTRPGVAECAFVVDEARQGRGLGSLLVEHLAEAASEAGIPTFEAEVLGSNTAMLEVFAAAGLPMVRRVSAGEVHLEFPTSLTPAAVEAFEQREARAAAAGIRAFLQPRTVALVGASRRPGSVGAELFHNLLAFGFRGTVYPVNPNAQAIQGVACFPSVGAVPGPLDLAVIAVPAASVLGVARGWWPVGPGGPSSSSCTTSPCGSHP